MSEIQVTLGSEFGSQKGYVKIEYDFTDLQKQKRCTDCGVMKNADEFCVDFRTPNRKRTQCKSCAQTYSQRWKSENKERLFKTRRKYEKEAKERSFLIHRVSKNRHSGFLYGTGCCLLCMAIDPLILENHHIIPRKDSDDDFLISLCASCHRKYHSGKQIIHMRAVQNAIEKNKKLWEEFK